MKLYGIAELAEAVGASPILLAKWRERGKLPTPSAELAMGPVWTSEVAEPWIAQQLAGKPAGANVLG